MILKFCGRRWGLSKTHINSFSIVYINAYIAIVLSIFLLSCGIDSTELLTQGNAALKSGDTITAQRHFQRILDRHPESPDAIAGMLSAAMIEHATESQLMWSRELLQYRPWHREANLITGTKLLEDGNLKDAVIRLTLAFQNSTFQNEKKEALALLQQAVLLTEQKYAQPLSPQDQIHDKTQ